MMGELFVLAVQQYLQLEGSYCHVCLRSYCQTGLEVPPTPKLAVAYVPAVAGKLAFSSGQTNTVDGVPTVKGKVGREVTLEEAYQAARVAVLNAWPA